jgi:CRP-like cAMP-binding protein
MNTINEMSAKAPRPLSSGNGDGRSLGNEILLTIPYEEVNLLLPKLEFVRLRIHQILHEAGDKIKSVYFIESGLLSIVNLQPDGKSVEVGLVGKGGFAGLPIVDGFRTSPNRAVAQAEGTAYRMEADTLRQLLPQCPVLSRELHRFGQRLTMQAMQIAACNRLHEVDERLARWLLMSQDLLGSNELPLTQELLGQMLGTRRSSVSLAAGMLHKAAVITYTRGNVTILDKARLQEAACECYSAIQHQLRSWEAESREF